MNSESTTLLQEALDISILKSLVAGEMHRLGISRRIQAALLSSKRGSLVPLHTGEGGLDSLLGGTPKQLSREVLPLDQSWTEANGRWSTNNGAASLGLSLKPWGHLREVFGMPLVVKFRCFLRHLFPTRRVEVGLDQDVHSHLERLLEEKHSYGHAAEGSATRRSDRTWAGRAADSFTATHQGCYFQLLRKGFESIWTVAIF